MEPDERDEHHRNRHHGYRRDAVPISLARLHGVPRCSSHPARIRRIGMHINLIRVVRDLTDLRNDLDTAIREHESRGQAPDYLLAAEDAVRELINYLVEQGER